MKSDGTIEFATTDAMDGCSVLPVTQFVGTRLRVDTTQILSVGAAFPLGELHEREVRVKHQTNFWGSTPELSSRLSPEVFSTYGYFRETAGV